jgi:hypothetical protein
MRRRWPEWRKPGVQSGQGELPGWVFGLPLQPRYRGWEGRRQVLRRRHRASQLWENNPPQNGFVDAERPGDLEHDTSAETQFIEFYRDFGLRVVVGLVRRAAPGKN